MTLFDASATTALYQQHLATLAQRWEQALTATNIDRAVISAGSNSNYFLDDQAPPFRPNPHFAQWVPDRNTEHCELLLAPGETPVLLFYQPDDYWHLPPAVPDWASANFTLERHNSLAELTASRNNWLKGSNNQASIGPQPTLENHNPDHLLAHLDFLRCQKTPFEVAAIKKATELSVAGHIAARDAFFSGASEYQIYLAFLGATGNTAAELPYNAIVALNTHGGVLHYQHYEAQSPDAHLSFLIDAGASHLGYASDITRTYSTATQQPPGQKVAAPGEFADLIDALDRCQLELIETIRTGQPYAQLHGNMIDRIALLLCDSGILECSQDEAIAGKFADPFMPHGLGHLIGLQTHDVGGQLADTSGALAPPDERFPALRLTRTLEPDSVFTIEPGIYFIPLLLDSLRATTTPINWRLVDALIPCGGIRIEDNVWLTGDGPVNLTREAFARV